MNIELVTLTITIVSFLCWTAFDYYGFYLISTIKFQVRDLELIICFLISIAISVVNLWFSIIASASEIIIFYLWFRNRQKSKFIVIGSVLIIQIIDIFGDILINILQIFQSETIKGILISELTNLVLLGIFFVLLFNTRDKIYKLLDLKYGKSFVFILGYFYISTELFSAIIEIENNRKIIISALFGIIILQSIFISVAFYFNYSINKKLLDANQQQQLQQHLSDVEEYAEYLESNEDDLRRFKHDVKNLLSSIKLASNFEADVLVDYVENYVDENTLKAYKDLNHLKMKPLKSLVLTKIATMISKNINYNFECTQIIKNIPNNLQIFDLVRILGIAFDNAIEASEKNIIGRHIDIMFYKNEEQGIEVEIRNSFDNKNLDINKIFSRGFTTKKDHNGDGLFNVRELISKYSNLSLDVYTENDNFIFYLVIDEG